MSLGRWEELFTRDRHKGNTGFGEGPAIYGKAIGVKGYMGRLREDGNG